MDLHEIFREDWQWASEQMIKFWWRSQTDSPHGRTDIVTLVRRALAEVCSVPMLLVSYCTDRGYGDGAANTIEENSSVSLIRMCYLLSARACGQ